MRSRLWGLGIGALIGGLLALPGGARAADKDLPGPIDSVEDLQDTGKMVFKMADVNNDGQISQKEATDAGNLLVGGFFFRADANGDGVVSREEAQQARDSFLRQKPLLRVVIERAGPRGSTQPGQRNAQAQNSMQGIMSLVDTNNDGQLQATELRQTVQTGVQGLYASADTNRDGQLSPSELNAAVVGAAQAAAQASFQAADKDGNGSLSQAEFNQAIIEPANTVFRVIDADGDGQISQQEAQSAQRVVANQIRLLKVPEAGNSLRHRAEAGQGTSAPGTAPALGSPTTRRAARPVQPPPRSQQPAAPAPRTQPQPQ